MITISDNAAKHLQELIQEDPDRAGKGLRIYIESGGCAGSQYNMTFDTPKPDDYIAESHGVQVLVDPESLKSISGSQIDYENSLANTGFKIHNPKAVRSCGCGTSFEPPEETN